MLILLIAIIWCVPGIAWSIYDWTNDFDLEVKDIPAQIFLGGIIGLSFIPVVIAKIIFRNHAHRVLMKKRGVK